MRCLVCQSLSFKIICQTCQDNLLSSLLHKRELTNKFYVYNFFNYNEIKSLLNSKYYFFGDRIFTILANISFRKFSNNFDFPNEVYVIPIDDNPKSTFSHSAILARSMKNTKVKIQYNSLIAKNHIKYAGKSLEFRKRNKRNFKYTGKTNIKVILVDDIITTGLTILEAKNVLENNHCKVLFALTLSDAKLC